MVVEWWRLRTCFTLQNDDPHRCGQTWRFSPQRFVSIMMSLYDISIFINPSRTIFSKFLQKNNEKNRKLSVRQNYLFPGELRRALISALPSPIIDNLIFAADCAWWRHHPSTTRSTTRITTHFFDTIADTLYRSDLFFSSKNITDSVTAFSESFTTAPVPCQNIRWNFNDNSRKLRSEFFYFS